MGLSVYLSSALEPASRWGRGRGFYGPKNVFSTESLRISTDCRVISRESSVCLAACSDVKQIVIYAPIPHVAPPLGFVGWSAIRSLSRRCPRACVIAGDRSQRADARLVQLEGAARVPADAASASPRCCPNYDTRSHNLGHIDLRHPIVFRAPWGIWCADEGCITTMDKVERSFAAAAAMSFVVLVVGVVLLTIM